MMASLQTADHDAAFAGIDTHLYQSGEAYYPLACEAGLPKSAIEKRGAESSTGDCTVKIDQRNLLPWHEWGCSTMIHYVLHSSLAVSKELGCFLLPQCKENLGGKKGMVDDIDYGKSYHVTGLPPSNFQDHKGQ